jgi:hypothetical protein
MTLPTAFQESYHKRLQYPESLITSSTAIYRSKLKSYRKRLDDAEQELCLIDGKHDVNATFEIPIIDLHTANGEGMYQEKHIQVFILMRCSVAETIHPLTRQAHQLVWRRGHIRRR